MIRKTACRFALFLLLVAACSLTGVAQDSAQVLRVYVGYSTLKNTVSSRLTPEARAEVDRLGQAAQQAAAAHKYGEALGHYYHAMSLLRGSEWTPSRAFSSSLTVKLDRVVLEPDQRLVIRLGQLFRPDEQLKGRISGEVVLLKMKGDEPLKVLTSVESVGQDLIASPAVIEAPMPEVEESGYRVAVRLKPEGGEPIEKVATIYLGRGLRDLARAAAARAADVEARLKKQGKDGLLAELPPAQYRIDLYDLAGRGEIGLDRIDFRAELKEAGAILDSLAAGRSAFASKRGDFRKAYRSKVDDTLQPYRIFVPAGYDGSKPFPLIIALHGMGGDENSYFDLYANGKFKEYAQERGYIVACPKGRQPASMYTGSAEKDVMDVIAEVRRAYRIDPDRIYMTGHSMGGFGSWSVAINHPDLFAAIAPIAGGGIPAFMARLRNVAQLVVHGDDDKTVPVERSRAMVEAARKLGIDIKYIEVPGGSHISIAVPAFKDVYDWFDSHRRGASEVKAAAGGSKNR